MLADVTPEPGNVWRYKMNAGAEEEVLLLHVADRGRLVFQILWAVGSWPKSAGETWTWSKASFAVASDGSFMELVA